MTASWPLLGDRDASLPLAWRDGVPLSAQQFVAAATALAERLPAHGAAINLCRDRWHFAIAFAAALLRGHTSLMPPNALPATLQALPGDDAYALVDDATFDAGGLPVVLVPDAAIAGGLPDMPLVPAGLEAVCLLTSGSTGTPQPHAKRWSALVRNIASEAERLAELIGRPTLAGVNLVATVPPQHSYGFESSVLLALLGGASFDAGRPFYPADIATALARLPAPRALVTTPFHLKTLLLSGVDLPPVALVLSATAPLSPQLAEEAEARLGATLVEIYGCTEAGQVAARRTTAGDVWTTLGALRIAAVDDAFTVSGGHVEQPTPLADVLELIDERRFRLLGRANDLIHVAGKRSSLQHLNFHLNRIDGVADGAFWMPDGDDSGVARPIAFVVAPGLTAQQVVRALRQRIESAFVPRRIVHVAALPREATGKLTADALARFARETLSTVTIPPDHPAFAGHFPGQPVLPGVVLLSLVLQALEHAPLLSRRLGPTPTIASVKFLRAVGPGAELVVQLDDDGAFSVRRGTTVVARGLLIAAA